MNVHTLFGEQQMNNSSSQGGDMTNQQKTTTSRLHRSERRSLLSFLMARREVGTRLIRGSQSNVDAPFLEVLDAIHRPAK
jgi:hypothetical protein